MKEDFAYYKKKIFWVITTLKSCCNDCSAMQSKRRDSAGQQTKLHPRGHPVTLFFLCSTVIKRMIVMTTADPYCPTCISLHAPWLPTQRLTSQLCMHDEQCISTERNRVTLRGARMNLQNRAARLILHQHTDHNISLQCWQQPKCTTISNEENYFK